MKARSRFPALALCAAVAFSAVDLAPSFMSLPGRGGFLWAGLATLAALLFLAARERRAFAGFLLRRRLLVLAAAAVVATRFASAAPAADTGAALAIAGKSAAVLGFLVAAAYERAASPEFPRLLAWTALGFVVLSLLAFLGGALAPVFRGAFFEAGVHERLATIPRFSGASGNPFLAGAQLLAAAGLMGALPRRALRRAGFWAAVALSAATLSAATLVVPLAAGFAITARRGLRIALVVAVAAGAVATLWVRPTAVRWDGATLLGAPPHPAWSEGDLGPRHMPLRTVEIGPLEADYHLTAYAYLARRSLACFAEHPALGVGGRNHPGSCPIVTMNTRGEWSSGRIAHGEYTGLLAEYGALGAMATAAFVLAIAAGFRPPEGDRLWAGGVAATLVAAVGGEIWFQYPFAALVARVEPRGRGVLSSSRIQPPGGHDRCPSTRSA